MKRLNILIGAIVLLLASCSKGGNDPRLVIITFDGLRWQEVFSGAAAGIVDNPEYVKDTAAMKAAYWRDTPEERRQALMPFIWSYVPEHGYLIGNREKGSRMEVSNKMKFSYPGYSEMFCGWGDDERINSNDPIPNPNTSVLEVAHRDPRYKGSIMVYASWESIRYAMNNERGGFPGSAKYEPGLSDTPTTHLLDEMQDGMPHHWGTERFDSFTYAYALETLKKDHPKVLYVGFGDTDEWAHAGQYDRYLESAHWTDAFIRRIVETCEADPFYKGKTTYILTTDHGRGRGEKYKHHSADIRGSGETWFIAFGKGIPVLGETSDNGVFETRQFAATIADILGIDFTPDNGERCAPIDPTYRHAQEQPAASASFPAVEATPKGQGLLYTYSEGNFMSIAQVLAAPVKTRGTAPVLSTAMKEREDHFGLTFKGLVKIEKEGLYLLSLANDDGGRLIFDGTLLIDCDRDGGGFTETWVELGAGFHRIEIQYFENHGGDGIEMGLEGPGILAENLPAQLLYHE